MEQTILESYVTGSNLRVFLDHADAKSAPALAELKSLMDEALATKTRGPVDNDEPDPSHPSGGCVEVQRQLKYKWTMLDDETFRACGFIDVAQVADFPGGITRRVLQVPKHVVRGALFTAAWSSQSQSKASSLVYFQSKPGTLLVPGQVQSIFATVHPIPGSSPAFQLRYFFAIRPFVDSNPADDPFLTTFPDFGARLHSKVLGDIIVVRCSMVDTHAWQREWDGDRVVMKRVSRVSSCHVPGFLRCS
jgi:hypothetical protein